MERALGTVFLSDFSEEGTELRSALGAVVLSCFSEEGTELRSALGALVLSGFSEEGTELRNVLWGLWSCLISLKRGQNCGTCSGDCGPVWFL